MSQSTMKGIQLIAHGGPEALVLNPSIPVPVPGKGDVLIEVTAAGVNNTDINTRIGWYSKNNASPDDASWTGQAMTLPCIWAPLMERH